PSFTVNRRFPVSRSPAGRGKGERERHRDRNQENSYTKEEKGGHDIVGIDEVPCQVCGQDRREADPKHCHPDCKASPVREPPCGHSNRCSIGNANTDTADHPEYEREHHQGGCSRRQKPAEPTEDPPNHGNHPWLEFLNVSAGNEHDDGKNRDKYREWHQHIVDRYCLPESQGKISDEGLDKDTPRVEGTEAEVDEHAEDHQHPSPV